MPTLLKNSSSAATASLSRRNVEQTEEGHTAPAHREFLYLEQVTVSREDFLASCAEFPELAQELAVDEPKINVYGPIEHDVFEAGYAFIAPRP
jgi:hypothetical protein